MYRYSIEMPIKSINNEHLFVNYFAGNKNVLIFASRFKKNTAF